MVRHAENVSISWRHHGTETNQIWSTRNCSKYGYYWYDNQSRWLPNQCGLPWWRHQMETFSALLALCAGNSPVPGEFPSQRPVTRSFDVFFDLRLNKRLSTQSWGWWFETQSRSLWRHCNVLKSYIYGSQTWSSMCWLHKLHNLSYEDSTTYSTYHCFML